MSLLHPLRQKLNRRAECPRTVASRQRNRNLLVEQLEGRLVLTAPNLKVAFIGDQGHGSGANAVLTLIKDEGAQMVLHQGDFDYANNPTAWDNRITRVLGANFPYFASVGNHDTKAWTGYRRKLTTRLARVPEASCTGQYGVNSACSYQGLFFILSGVGTSGSGHATYIRNQLAADNSTWSICSWHKDQKAMQVGKKPNETGWSVYEECRKGGAIIATAHNHSYQRTKTLTDTVNQTVDPACASPAELCVGPGRTFAFVSGLGGKDRSSHARCLPTAHPYGCKGEWASIYSKSQRAQFGALFVVFNYHADPLTAHGYFKTITGEVVDEFDVLASPSTYLPPGITVTPTSGLTTAETGDTATFRVVLHSQPTADVTIHLSSSDSTEGAVSPESLTFTTANWDVAQTVTVTGVPDETEDGNISYSIVTSAASSLDPHYELMDVPDVDVTNIDSEAESRGPRAEGQKMPNQLLVRSRTHPALRPPLSAFRPPSASRNDASRAVLPLPSDRVDSALADFQWSVLRKQRLDDFVHDLLRPVGGGSSTDQHLSS